MAAAPALLWECVKNHSSFIRKSPFPNMPVMSAEPGNMCGLNSFKFSGLANRQVLDVRCETNDKKESVQLVTSHSKASRLARPASMLLKVGLKKLSEHAVKSIAKATTSAYYRRDLALLAAVKYAKIKKSFQKRERIVKSRRAKK
mmetsp:Transcript_117293/g.331904  ORF Transcript_117293/g.331904 Transcript_117293/m.331904 type:complete len:145 (+) Transcript_117293:86-520(+)